MDQPGGLAGGGVGLAGSGEEEQQEAEGERGQGQGPPVQAGVGAVPGAAWAARAAARGPDGRERVCVGADMAASGVLTGTGSLLRIYGSEGAVPIRGAPQFTLTLAP